MVILSLLAMRQAIIIGVAILLSPLEFTFDLLEAELERRGVDPC